MKSRIIMKVLRDFIGCLPRLCYDALQFIGTIFIKLFYNKPEQPIPPIHDVILLYSATTLAKKIRTRQITSHQVVSTFIKRIKQVNPVVNCVVDLRFHDALEEAKRIDEEIAAGTKTEEEMEDETPFLGVPFTFKSCLSCKGMLNTAGLAVRRNCVATEDAVVIEYMKSAGAIPLASTNISELCLWWETYNSVHGRTNNPYNTNHSVGGSSGGEGCMQAFGGSPMGIGADVGGSIRIPAHFNGIFGHKPTNGYSKLKGHFPFICIPTLRPFLVLGPMSRFASDLLPMLKILSKDFSEDLKLNEKPNLKKLRYFYMDDDMGSQAITKIDPEIKDLILKVVKYFNDQHGIIFEKVKLYRLKHALGLWFTKLLPKEGPMIGKELANFRGSKNLVWEMIRFFFGTSSHTFPILVAGMIERYAMKYGDSLHTFFLSECEKLKQEFENLLGTDGIFICPTLPTAAPLHRGSWTKPFDFTYTAVFNGLGFPVTHCPIGFNSCGLPIGIQVVAPEKYDRYSIAVAEELERGFGGWVPPQKR